MGHSGHCDPSFPIAEHNSISIDMGGRFSKSWTIDQAPDLDGKVAIVTGANSGIGYETALGLGRRGATVTLACRDEERGGEALNKLLAACPTGRFNLMLLDISSLADIDRFATEFAKGNTKLDILVNNAGIMMPPTRGLSKDGFELQLATNHLGPYALTAKLMPLLSASATPRVVAVSSQGAWLGRTYSDIDFRREHDYSPLQVYCDSKLDNLLFMLELGRRYPNITSVGAHPGSTATNLQRYSFGSVKFLMQSAASGALPILRAATDDTARQAAYYGPFLVSAGAPVEAYIPWRAQDADSASKMWDACAAATGIHY